MSLQRIITQSQDLQLVQDNVDRALTVLQNSPLFGGQLLSNLSLTNAVDNIVSHTLGYTPTIILFLAPNVDTRLWSPVTATLNGSNASATQVNLRCSAACTVSVLVK